MDKDQESSYTKSPEQIRAEAYIASLNLSEEEQMLIEQSSVRKVFPKGHVLRREGQTSELSYYVFAGCVRQYILVDGEEKTTFFFTEESSMYAGINYCLEPSKFFLECVEETEVSVTSEEQQKKVYQKFPRFEKLCRETTESDLIRFRELFTDYMSSTPEERYIRILKDRPTLLDRVPQYQLASYIGVKPESLSRIRKRLSSK